MTAKTKILNTDDIQINISVAMSLREWKIIYNSLTDTYKNPTNDFVRTIRKAVSAVENELKIDPTNE